MRTYAFTRFARQVNGDNFGTFNVVGLTQQLFNQLRSPLADSQSAQRAVTRVTVRTEYHSAAARLHLTHVLMDYGNMRRHVITAVFFCRGKTESMVVRVYRTSDRTKRVVAVGKRIR